jgi:hypothetical protein
VIFQYGYGSIPINTIFSGLFTSILTQLFWCEQKRGTIGFDPLPYWGIRLMYQMIIVRWIPWSWIITYNHIYRWLSVNYKPITRDKLMIIWIIVLCLSLVIGEAHISPGLLRGWGDGCPAPREGSAGEPRLQISNGWSKMNGGSL